MPAILPPVARLLSPTVRRRRPTHGRTRRGGSSRRRKIIPPLLDPKTPQRPPLGVFPRPVIVGVFDKDGGVLPAVIEEERFDGCADRGAGVWGGEERGGSGGRGEGEVVQPGIDGGEGVVRSEGVPGAETEFEGRRDSARSS